MAAPRRRRDSRPEGLGLSDGSPLLQLGVDPPGFRLDPSRALMAAVLMDAVDILRKGPLGGSAVRLYRDAEAWCTSSDTETLFGFLNVCHALGLDPDAVRGRVLPGASSR